MDDESAYSAAAVGKRIKEARESMPGFTQDDLARSVGVKAGTISQYERVGMDLKISTLVPMARALGRSITWLCTGEELEPPPAIYFEFLSHVSPETSPRYLAALRSIRFPAGIAPTVALYRRLLIDLETEAKLQGTDSRPSDRPRSGLRIKDVK